MDFLKLEKSKFKKSPSNIKDKPSLLHPRNRHKKQYDINLLCRLYPALKDYVVTKPNNLLTINFSNANAVKALNVALLKQSYHIEYWDIPQGYLCPAIPGRVDYIHYLADLLLQSKSAFDQNIVNDDNVLVLDIGTGAGCIYPILGNAEYNWRFIATDIDEVSINNAKGILEKNKHLKQSIDCRLQTNKQDIFKGIINEDEFYHLTMCNPPFHKSLKEAMAGNKRKTANLSNGMSKNSNRPANLNFGGQKAELWCPGGEVKFIRDMIKESKNYRSQVLWFSVLISKSDNVSTIKLSLKKANVSQFKVVKMAQGNKVSRFVAWSFHSF